MNDRVDIVLANWQIEAIKAKYRGRTDQATMRKQQEEIMELQQKEGYSMLAGCLPVLIQMPILISCWYWWTAAPELQRCCWFD